MEPDRSVTDFLTEYTTTGGGVLLSVLAAAYGEFAYQHGIPNPVPQPRFRARFDETTGLSCEQIEIRGDRYRRYSGRALTEAGMELATTRCLRQVSWKEMAHQSGAIQTLHRECPPLVRETGSMWEIPNHVPSTALTEARKHPVPSYFLEPSRVPSLSGY